MNIFLSSNWYKGLFIYLKDDFLKTNNNIEDWHNEFSDFIVSTHPNKWKCINFFKKEENINKITIEQRIAGDVLQKKKNEIKKI